MAKALTEMNLVDGNTALSTSIYTGDSVDSILSNEYGVFGFEAAVGEGHVDFGWPAFVLFCGGGRWAATAA